MSKPNWKVALEMDSQDDYHMLVEANNVEKINDYSVSADGVVIKYNDPIEYIERIKDDPKCVIYCEYKSDIGWSKEYINTDSPLGKECQKKDATILSMYDAMQICKELNKTFFTERYRIEDV
jgi:hypothetical protein